MIKAPVSKFKVTMRVEDLDCIDPLPDFVCTLDTKDDLEEAIKLAKDNYVPGCKHTYVHNDDGEILYKSN